MVNSVLEMEINRKRKNGKYLIFKSVLFLQKNRGLNASLEHFELQESS
jgi:hypothetical protein